MTPVTASTQRSSLQRQQKQQQQNQPQPNQSDIRNYYYYQNQSPRNSNVSSPPAKQQQQQEQQEQRQQLQNVAKPSNQLLSAIQSRKKDDNDGSKIYNPYAVPRVARGNSHNKSNSSRMRNSNASGISSTRQRILLDSSDDDSIDDTDNVVDHDHDNDNDPYNLYERFVLNQKSQFRRALIEIRQGQKRSCWLWFIIPTAPYVVNGVERGSSMNRHFALRGGDDCVKAYLQYNEENEGTAKSEGINLRTNYIEIVKAIMMQLKGGNSLRHMFGSLDDVKVVSSLELFERVGKDMNDTELSDLCGKVLELANAKKPKSKRNSSPKKGMHS